MGEENIDITIASEEIEPEIGDMINNSLSPTEEHNDNGKEQTDMDCDVNASESADWSTDKSTDVVKEEDEELRQNHQILDSTSDQPSPAEVTDLSGPLRRPTAVIVGADVKFTIRSRYRRASMGSCHDACKYGHKHEPEKVNRRPVLGTIKENKPLTRTISVGHLAKSVPEKETKNKALLRRLSLPGILEKDPPSRTDGATSSKKVTSSPTPSKGKRIQSEARTPGSSFSRSKVNTPAVKKTPQQKSGQKVKEIKTKEVGSSSESKAMSSSESKRVKAKEPITNSSRTLLKKSASIKARLYKDSKNSPRSRHQNISENVKANESSDVVEKVVVVEPKASTSRAGRDLRSSLFNKESSSTQSEPRAVKAKSSNDTKKGSRFSLSSVSSQFTSKSDASSSRRTGQPQGQSRQKSDSINTKPTGGLLTEAGGSKPRTPRSKPAVNLKNKAKKIESSRPEEKDGSAWKVKFRRGTVVNLQVANNAPRKLRFKRGSILGDQNAKADADKNLKNTDDMTNETPDKKPEREKVQLRRQEASSKKDSVDLNDVIEETASKLVKTRKSKVKALVGAFETVMSFRDRKPMVETGAS
ncbi:hypothetical protein vseg_003038 [Gypsophila vaccaria]